MNCSMNNRNGNGWKVRGGPDGLHAFNRTTGMNILFDEVAVPISLHSRAPRQISIALTNYCDLACVHCYAPKFRAELHFDAVTRWLRELDDHGTLGVGFGGGEPTLHPAFPEICQYTANETRLSVSFTTHGHHVDSELVERLGGSVNFIRVSMDGVGPTYEAIRRRSFLELLERLREVRAISSFGVNVVVNDHTVPELDEVAHVAADAGACELLLLPQVPVRRVLAASIDTLQRLRNWVKCYKGPLKLCINESSAEGFQTCDPMTRERGLRAFAHIDATGIVRPSSYSETGVQLKECGVIHALDQLAHKLVENNT